MNQKTDFSSCRIESSLYNGIVDSADDELRNRTGRATSGRTGGETGGTSGSKRNQS